MPASKSGVWKNPKHGTATGYRNYQCRCETCRAWNNRQQRDRRAKHPQYFRAYYRSFRNNKPESWRRAAVLRRYGISVAQYESLLAAQNGVCAICLREPKRGYLHVDHDHTCCKGQRSHGCCVRGLLCADCNLAIACLSDDPERLKRALIYIIRSAKTEST